MRRTLVACTSYRLQLKNLKIRRIFIYGLNHFSCMRNEVNTIFIIQRYCWMRITISLVPMKCLPVSCWQLLYFPKGWTKAAWESKARQSNTCFLRSICIVRNPYVQSMVTGQGHRWQLFKERWFRMKRSRMNCHTHLNYGNRESSVSNVILV